MVRSLADDLSDALMSSKLFAFIPGNRWILRLAERGIRYDTASRRLIGSSYSRFSKFQDLENRIGSLGTELLRKAWDSGAGRITDWKQPRTSEELQDPPFKHLNDKQPLPPVFNFPVPEPSAWYTYRGETVRKMLGETAPTLGSVQDRIIKGLHAGGYTECSYYAVEHGFALVTRIERMSSDDGTSLTTDRRNLNPPPASITSLGDLLRILFTARPGYFRVFVFIVSTGDVFIDRSIPPREVDSRRYSGGTRLPGRIRSLPFSKDYGLTVPAYEMERYASRDTVEVQTPGRFDFKDHISAAGSPERLSAVFKLEK